jgi:hypothetical protein
MWKFLQKTKPAATCGYYQLDTKTTRYCLTIKEIHAKAHQRQRITFEILLLSSTLSPKRKIKG